MATLLRCASSNISSGSSDPSIWRCSSALGSAAMKAARSSREAKPSGTGSPLLPKDDRRLGLVAADFLDRQPVDLVREDQPLVGFVDEEIGAEVGDVAAGLEPDGGDADVTWHIVAAARSEEGRVGKEWVN